MASCGVLQQPVQARAAVRSVDRNEASKFSPVAPFCRSRNLRKLSNSLALCSIFSSCVFFVRNSCITRTAFVLRRRSVSSRVPAIAVRSWYGNPRIGSDNVLRSSSVNAGSPSKEQVSQLSRSGNFVTRRFLAFRSSSSTVRPKDSSAFASMQIVTVEFPCSASNARFVTAGAVRNRGQRGFAFGLPFPDRGSPHRAVRIEQVHQLQWGCWFAVGRQSPPEFACASTR